MPATSLCVRVVVTMPVSYAQFNDQEATAAFKDEIVNSEGTVSRQFDNMIHQVKHKL